MEVCTEDLKNRKLICRHILASTSKTENYFSPCRWFMGNLSLFQSQQFDEENVVFLTIPVEYLCLIFLSLNVHLG